MVLAAFLAAVVFAAAAGAISPFDAPLAAVAGDAPARLVVVAAAAVALAVAAAPIN